MWGLQYDSGPDLESGQFLVNKSRCWHELQVTMWLNEHSDWVYRDVYGDKSTYNLAWAGCETDFVLPRKLPEWEHPAIFQFDPYDELVFQHCAQGKQQLANGILIPCLNNPQWAVDAIKTLKKHWDGQLYHQGDSLALGKFKVKLLKDVNYTFKLQTTTVQPMEFDIELGQGGSIKGATLGFRSWYLKNENELLFMSKGKVAHQFFRDENGNRWFDPKNQIEGFLG